MDVEGGELGDSCVGEDDVDASEPGQEEERRVRDELTRERRAPQRSDGK